MADIDQALARAYARRGPSDAAGTPPAPHFPVEPGPNSAGSAVQLEWPAIIRALEREHGERFDLLADALIQARDQRQAKALLFTSCHRAEGRTTLLLTLARSLARRGGRTLLVDADLSGPMMARSLGLRPRLGLDDVIEDGLAASDAILEAPDDHLSILPLRAPVARPREFLANPAWPTVMGRLRREYDLILIDGSPLFAGLGAAILHRSVDAAVLVHNRALTGDRAVYRARQVLEAGGIPLLGLAETFV
ncbi:CpsD/CapB family tyrosine-protein kinase [Tundrisphaera sp. TA3]|uniref:CpsD/CapB family tyrosine-protein kinase n=1 Tax=Tundrisphaera sp. TA3 TaxID=3435775 RepID=UPI003EBD8ED4